METIKEVLHSVVAGLMKKEKEAGYEKALAAWKKIAGPKACAHTRIVYLTKDKIRINVDNSAWLYELNLKKEALQKELNKVLKTQDVKFRLGSVKN